MIHKTTATARRKESSNFSQLFKALAIRHLSRNAHAISPAENASERTSGKPKKGLKKRKKEHTACTLHGYRVYSTRGPMGRLRFCAWIEVSE
jgi:hypothetical protein